MLSLQLRGFNLCAVTFLSAVELRAFDTGNLH